MANRGIIGVYLGMSQTVAGGHVVWYPNQQFENNTEYLKGFGVILHTMDVQFDEENLFMDYLKSEHNYQHNAIYDDLLFQEEEHADNQIEEINQLDTNSNELPTDNNADLNDNHHKSFQSNLDRKE